MQVAVDHSPQPTSTGAQAKVTGRNRTGQGPGQDTTEQGRGWGPTTAQTRHRLHRCVAAKSAWHGCAEFDGELDWTVDHIER